MRVAVVTESFLPHVNGVTNSVLRVLEHLERRGHQGLVVAPAASGAVGSYAGAEVVRVPSVRMPGYPDVAISVSGARRLARTLEDFAPDVVHLASPFVLGGPAARAAERLGVPVVAAYQTDVAGFATRYGLGAAHGAAWRRIESIHARAQRTLAPSRAAMDSLRAHGVHDVVHWPRGVDASRFRPDRRDPAVRARLAPRGEVVVGYVGRLAAEKRVEDLVALADLPGVRLAVVGDGPQRGLLEARLPEATFLGFLGGDDLARAVASLDVFVHPGPHETFCQAAQEALASAVPVVGCAVGGLLDLVDPSHTGWLYRPGDRPALRAAVTDLAGDRFKRHAFAEAARESVLPRTWERVCDDLLGHYREVVAAARSTAAL